MTNYHLTLTINYPDGIEREVKEGSMELPMMLAYAKSIVEDFTNDKATSIVLVITKGEAK